MAREGRDLARRLHAYVARGDQARLEEAVSFLRTPRSLQLAEGLRALPDGSGGEVGDALAEAREMGRSAVTRAAADGCLERGAARLAASRYLSKDPPGRTP